MPIEAIIKAQLERDQDALEALSKRGHDRLVRLLRRHDSDERGWNACDQPDPMLSFLYRMVQHNSMPVVRFQRVVEACFKHTHMLTLESDVDRLGALVWEFGLESSIPAMDKFLDAFHRESWYWRDSGRGGAVRAPTPARGVI